MSGTIQERTDVAEVGGGPMVEVLYFTDPYCSWCWAAEPVWLHLKEAYGGAVHFRTVMGGLVERAGQDMMGERLMLLRQHMHDVSARSGQPIDPSFLDAVDPEFSTWPACIHVKAAQAQAEDLGERYLRRLRRAIMTECRQASDPGVAEKLVDDVEGLETTRWKTDVVDGTALSAFLDDRKTCEQFGVTGFPTIVIRTSDPDRAPRVLPGYRPYPEVEQALKERAPWVQPRDTRTPIDLLFDMGPLTTKEIQEIQGTTPRETMDVLDGLAAEGTIEAVRIAGGTLWRLPE